MCGICGIVGAAAPQTERAERMLRLLAHRGPDDCGLEAPRGATLGHRRLSILDLERGHQPMSSHSGRMHVVFNGEIYNFAELRSALEKAGARFTTRSDTEVLLELVEREWTAALPKLRGMFAFAVFDELEQRLLLVRDRLGQKPLFYSLAPDSSLIFASEAKAIVHSGSGAPRLDTQALYHYMSLRFIPDQRTLFRGVHKLPAAHFLLYERGHASVHRYWHLSDTSSREGSDAELLRELEDRLVESVRLHAISDVPVGCFLSGGVDSSLVTAIHARNSAERVHTFSIGVTESGFDELPYARALAERAGTIHHESRAQPDLALSIPRLVWHMDEPSDPFAVGVDLVARLAKDHVKVVLTGDGGDELFAGYDRYLGAELMDWYSLVPRTVRKTVVPRLLRLIPETFAYKSLAQKLRWLNDVSLAGAPGRRYARSLDFLRFSEDDKAALFNREILASLEERDSAEKIISYHDEHAAASSLARMLYTDLMTRLPDHLLVLVDRMTMSHGIEARPPFLDHELVEFAARLPDRMLIRRGRLKYALRRVGERYLPGQLVGRSKQGFGFPLALWMRGDLAPLLRATLRESRLVAHGLLNLQPAEQLLHEHLSGGRDHNFRLWLLLNLEVWYRAHIERATTEELEDWMASHMPQTQTAVSV